MHNVSQRIYDLIQSSANCTNAKLAKYIGVDRSTVSKWFNDSSEPEPDYKNVVKTAEFFNVSVEYLLNGTDKKTDSSTVEIVDMDAEIKRLLNVLTDGEVVYISGEAISDVGKKALINSFHKDLELIELIKNTQKKGCL